jgi:hypothetical protein
VVSPSAKFSRTFFEKVEAPHALIITILKAKATQLTGKLFVF